ncbi:hypothetical protein F5Y04DRAFT_133324 [Hypomontagnella monticulosa]|nr:hypothetical protein F5Y04DRAFT_133324 [Hypomontagnella monticulosa]
MSLGPQVVMPGAFHFDTPTRDTSLTGVHPGIFRPPISPSASSSVYLGKSTGSLYSDPSTPAPNVKRKRRGPRDPSSMSYNDWAMNPGDSGFGLDGAYSEKFDATRSTRGRGRQYVLAGQIETPNGAPTTDIQDAMEDSVYSDVDYRRALGPRNSPAEAALRNINDAIMKSSPPRATQPNGWGSAALSTIGGVVGKVFAFCKAGVFRGFYAGGGRGYEMRTPPRQRSPPAGQIWCNEHDVPTLPSFETGTAPMAIPHSDDPPPYYERATPESTPPPAAKRRQIGDGVSGDELRRNWVLVQEPALKPRPQSTASRAPTGNPPQEQSPFPPVLRRRISRPVSRVNTPGFTRRQSSRISYAGTASLSHREPASFASPRAQSPAAPYTPSRIPVRSRPQSPSPVRISQQPSFIPSPSAHPKRSHRRNHSTMSAASVASSRVKRRDSVQDLQDCSPRLDAEARNLAARRLQEEMETDMRMNDLNDRLRDMIRQGKEALGTMVDVENDGDSRGVDPWEDE